MIDVCVLYEHSGDQKPHGSSFIRLINPLTHYKLKNKIKMTARTSYDQTDPDMIIVDRLWSPDIDIYKAEKLVDFCRKKGASLIYSIDDNLIDLNINGPGRIRPTIHEKNVIRYFVREADGVIVSTQPLKERLEDLNERIIVVENALDEKLIEIGRRNPKRGEKLTLGYMGTYTHDRDFIEIYPALRKIIHKYKYQVRLEVVGALSDDKLLKSIPNATRLETRGNEEYSKFWGWMNRNIHWDMAIAPLIKNEFTKCKSDIKFLDYAALGAPAICTKFAPYERSVIHKKNGLIVENDTESWIDAMEALINDQELRAKLRRNAQEYLLSNRTLDKCISRWENALSEICGLESGS